jgi:hypothetical protein
LPCKAIIKLGAALVVAVHAQQSAALEKPKQKQSFRSGKIFSV